MLPLFLINLDRRPDRRATMAAQLERVGVVWRRVPALDARTVSDARLVQDVAVTGHQVPMGRGSMCCAATNFDVYRTIVAEDMPAAMIVQDDAELASDVAVFLADAAWIPAGTGVVQCEVYQDRPVRRLTGPGRPTPAEGRRVHRLHARTVGAAAYIITRGAAKICLAQAPIRMPIDHFLFNPNLSPVFHRLGVGVVMPALARQSPEAGSDMAGERQTRPRPKGVGAKLGRLIYDLRPVPRQFAALACGARMRPLAFRDGPASDVAARSMR
jgi:glycosyl transferase family 25